MGLFKKDPCGICGGKTGMLDKKILDGKICKECAKKLSPWFEDFKGTDSVLLDAQITYRQSNQVFLPDLNFTKVFGEFGRILMDEEQRKFVAIRDTSDGLFGDQKKITTAQDCKPYEPDILKFEQVKDVEIEITEMSKEEKRMVDGELVSYDPPKFTYSYMFYLTLILEHPYFKRVRLQLNNEAVQITTVGRRVWTDPGRKLAAHLLDLPGLVIEDQEAVYDNDSLIDWFYHSPYEMPEFSYGFRCSLANWDGIRRYHYFLIMAREIQQILMGE